MAMDKVSSTTTKQKMVKTAAAHSEYIDHPLQGDKNKISSSELQIPIL